MQVYKIQNASYARYKNILLYYTHPSCDDVGWGEVRWMTKVLWYNVSLLLSFWKYIRRRTICFWWSWIMEPWQRWWLDVRSRLWWCLGVPGRMEWDSVRFHQATQNCVPFRTYDLFLFGIIYLILWDHGWPQVAEIMEREAMDKRGLLCECYHASQWMNKWMEASVSLFCFYFPQLHSW